MAANIPDQGAIAHLGGQFQHNIFASAEKHLNKKAEGYAHAAQGVAKQTAANRQKFAQSATQAVKQGQAAYAKKQGAAAKVMQQQRNSAHGQAIQQQNQMSKSGASAQAKNAKTMQSQVNFAHGQALTFQSAQFRVQQQQKNYAHGQAIQHQKQMNKPTKGGPVNTTTTPKAPSLTPSFSSAQTAHTPVKAKPIPSTSFSSQLAPQKPLTGPVGTATASFSSGSTPAKPAPKPAPKTGVTGTQFSDVSPKVGSPYPQHAHPQGSSTAPLPNLTAAQPKPNTFTVGSRNAKPGGLAARGSQLEAWAIGKQAEVRAQRKTT